MPAVSRASYNTFGSSRATAIAAPTGIETPLIQTTALLPHRAQPKATAASATSTTIGPVPVTMWTPPVSQATARAAPGACRESETATATPTTTRTSPSRLVTTSSSGISHIPSRRTAAPASASGTHGDHRRSSGSAVMRVIEPCTRSPVGATYQLVEQLRVGQAGCGEHPRHLRVLGHAGDRVHLVQDRTVTGEEEVDPSHPRAAQRLVRRDRRVHECLGLGLGQRCRDAEVRVPAVLRVVVEEPVADDLQGRRDEQRPVGPAQHRDVDLAAGDDLLDERPGVEAERRV